MGVGRSSEGERDREEWPAGGRPAGPEASLFSRVGEVGGVSASSPESDLQDLQEGGN